jgi:oligoribonuclease (3'-5' exoribonuclease)
MATKPILTRINAQLKAAGLSQRFIRGRGYYYVTDVAVSSMLCWCWMPSIYEKDYSKCYDAAVDHVNEVLRNEGIKFQLVKFL